MTTEAIKLAEIIEMTIQPRHIQNQAAAELRRLDAENNRLFKEKEHADFAAEVADIDVKYLKALNKELVVALKKAKNQIGPEAMDCCGCKEEWNEAISIMDVALAKAGELK